MQNVENIPDISLSETIPPLPPLHGPLRYTLTNDYMFRAVMQSSNEALKHLLSALLGISYDSIESCVINNPIELGETISDKTTIMDIKCTLNDSKIINIEMQTGDFNHWADRSLYYLCGAYRNLKSGEGYGQVKPAYHIGILTRHPFPEVSDYYSKYQLANLKTHHIYSDKFTLYVLSLDQLDHTSEEERSSEVYHWAKLFLATTWEEVQQMAAQNSYLADVPVQLQVLTEEEKIQLQCEARERYMRDMATISSSGFKKGKAEGRQETYDELSRLVTALISVGRSEDVTRIFNDREYCEQLLKEFNIM